MERRAWSSGFTALACCLLLSVAVVASQNRSVEIPEINSSILVYGPSDWLLPQGGGLSRCQQVVQNALAYQQSNLMFVPTAFWVDDGYMQLKSVNSQGNVTYFCLNRVDGTGPTPTDCAEATQEQVDTLTASMSACFKTATAAGLNIAISPHLDDGLGLGGWRNGLVFDPLEQYGNWTYTDFWLYPLADALAQALTPTTEVRFSMQGEMSATVVYYPDSYIELLDRLKERIMAGAPSGYPNSNIQIGISTNFNKICGCVLQDLVDTSQYIALYPAAFAPLKDSFDLVAISELYNMTDFIGISSYPSLTPGFATQELERATEQFDFEIGQFGVNITHLNKVMGTPIYWNEYGVGGGSNQNGMVPATTAADAAANPYFGIFGAYNASLDPWVLYNLNAASPVRAYNEYFYQQSILYANQTGTNSTFKYNVGGIFIWNGGSWDVQGIYPESTDDQGSWKDPNITPLIAAYNKQAALQNGGFSQNSGGIAPAAPSANSPATAAAGLALTAVQSSG